MLHGFQTKQNLQYGAKGNEVATSVPDSPSPAVAAPGQRQRETDLIMESLLREYLNSTPLSN
jgi:hypothetical protein